MKIPFPKYEAEIVAEIEHYLDMHHQTEVVDETWGEAPGLKNLRTRGLCPNRDLPDRATRGSLNYSRPMFQVINDERFSGNTLNVTPCTACDRFDRSWNCPQHAEVPWDAEGGRWVHPHVEGSAICRCGACMSPGFGMSDSIMRGYLDFAERQAGLWANQVARLEPFSLTLDVSLDPRFLEILGDTVQAPESSLQIEATRNDDNA